MFFEIVKHLMAFDISWFIDLLMDNLFWVFAFITVMYFFTDKKKPLEGAIIIAIDILAISALFGMTGMSFLTAEILAVYYISKIAFLAFFENSKFFGKNTIFASTIHAWSVILLCNIFFV